MPKSKAMGNAKSAKKDEFYTQLTDIEKEMRYYQALQGQDGALQLR